MEGENEKIKNITMKKKVWITTLELNKAGNRVLHNIPPTLAECEGDRYCRYTPLEGKYKGKTLSEYSYVIDSFDTVEEAIDNYNSLIDDCLEEIQDRKEELEEAYKKLESLRIK